MFFSGDNKGLYFSFCRVVIHSDINGIYSGKIKNLHAGQRMIFRTTGLSKEAQEVIEKKNNVRHIDIDFFKNLTQDDFIKINYFMEKARFSHPKPRPLWPIQEKALQDLINCECRCLIIKDQ